MPKLKETNLDEVKSVARTFLYLDIQPLQMGFVSHPFAQYTIQAAQINNNIEMLNITDDTDLQKWQEATKNAINKINDVFSFLHMINKPYLPAFFKQINSFLSKKDYSIFLAEMWMQVEFPNSDINVSQREFVRFFKKAKKQELMDENEYNIFQNLPDQIPVYRGLQPNAKELSLSWTLDRSVAEWFAKRFHNKDPKIVEATIQKKDVLAYFDGRNEKEIVLDPKYCQINAVIRL